MDPQPPAEGPVEGQAEEILEHDDQAPQEGPGTALAVAPPTAGAIVAGAKPTEIIGKATEIADALKALIDKQGLAVNVGGRRKHVEVGGWQALGTMLGALGGQPLHAETIWTRRLLDGDGQPQRTSYHVKETKHPQGKGKDKPVVEREYDVDGFDWEACVEIRTPAAIVVGRAEAMCSRAEDTWAQRPDQAVRSMAETRAESRAYRRAVGWIVSIAGYNPTPAEEMPPEQTNGAGGHGWAGHAFEGDLDKVRAAMADLLDAGAGPDVETANRIGDWIVKDCDGILPATVARAILALRKALKAGQTQEDIGQATEDLAHEPAAPAADRPPEPAAKDEAKDEHRIAAGTVPDTPVAREAYCTCPNEDGSDNECPIVGHGIPF